MTRSYVALLWTIRGHMPQQSQSILMGQNLMRGRLLGSLPSFEALWSFLQATTIFTAEMVAILLALTHISFDTANSFIIYSDSRSTLQVLGTLYPHKFLVLIIQRFLCDLYSYHKSVSFCWVPSHVGLPSNKRADTVGSLHTNIGHTPLTHSYIMAHEATTISTHCWVLSSLHSPECTLYLLSDFL